MCNAIAACVSFAKIAFPSRMNLLGAVFLSHLSSALRLALLGNVLFSQHCCPRSFPLLPGVYSSQASSALRRSLLVRFLFSRAGSPGTFLLLARFLPLHVLFVRAISILASFLFFEFAVFETFVFSQVCPSCKFPFLPNSQHLSSRFRFLWSFSPRIFSLLQRLLSLDVPYSFKVALFPGFLFSQVLISLSVHFLSDVVPFDPSSYRRLSPRGVHFLSQVCFSRRFSLIPGLSFSQWLSSYTRPFLTQFASSQAYFSHRITLRYCFLSFPPCRFHFSEIVFPFRFRLCLGVLSSQAFSSRRRRSLRASSYLRFSFLEGLFFFDVPFLRKCHSEAVSPRNFLLLLCFFLVRRINIIFQASIPCMVRLLCGGFFLSFHLMSNILPSQISFSLRNPHFTGLHFSEIAHSSQISLLLYAPLFAYLLFFHAFFFAGSIFSEASLHTGFPRFSNFPASQISSSLIRPFLTGFIFLGECFHRKRSLLSGVLSSQLPLHSRLPFSHAFLWLFFCGKIVNLHIIL